MRISDWSSDVCSSDLFGRFDLVGHDFGGMVAWMVAGHHPGRVRTLTVASTPHPAAFRSSYKEGGSDQHERSGYMRAFREAPRGELETAMLADEAAGLRAVYADLPPESVRSEEHTSELQSLMRISYAVFCLKK